MKLSLSIASAEIAKLPAVIKRYMPTVNTVALESMIAGASFPSAGTFTIDLPIGDATTPAMLTIEIYTTP